MHDDNRFTNEPERLQQLELRVDRLLRGYVQFFRVEAAPQGIVLRGLARSYYAKQLAQHAVMGASALRIVANEIEVASAPRLDRPRGGPVDASGA